ncbi:MAG: histone deacetylase [Chloroflexota bacterium]
MTQFATYLHRQTVLTSKPAEEIAFTGYSWPYFSQVQHELERLLQNYPSLSVRQVNSNEYYRIHSKAYVDKLRWLSQDVIVDESLELGIGCDGLAYCLPGYEFSLGGMYEAVEKAKSGLVERAYCFSLGGHHAFRETGHGYCILNPQAVAARYAQELGFEKILIVDWDLHHGDGTQSIFANDKTVYCLSIHSIADLYMTVSKGLRMATTESGQSIGHCNIPILADAFDDDFFEHMNLDGEFYRAKDSVRKFEEAIENVPWLPDYIFIFSGYDAHINDQGRGVMNWDNEDYQFLTRIVLELSKKAGCPVLSVHGGGYTLPVTIDAALSHVEVLAKF